MKNWQKLGLIALVIGSIATVKLAFFTNNEQKPEEVQTQNEEIVKPQEQPDENAPKSYVNIYFIGQNKKNEEVYKIIKRQYSSKKGTKIKYAIESLINGPTSKEKTRGIYSEIPSGTKLISLEETPEKVVINLSENFEQGGGTEGLYKRVYQLIKTANKNTTLDVYLEIEGKQVDTIGGEGIMINQPLNDKSLDE